MYPLLFKQKGREVFFAAFLIKKKAAGFSITLGFSAFVM
jgi:hypothetical protein